MNPPATDPLSKYLLNGDSYRRIKELIAVNSGDQTANEKQGPEELESWTPGLLSRNSAWQGEERARAVENPVGHGRFESSLHGPQPGFDDQGCVLLDCGFDELGKDLAGQFIVIEPFAF